MPPNPPRKPRRFAQYIPQARCIFLPNNIPPPCLNMDLCPWSHLWKFNSSGFDKCGKSWNIAVCILLGLPFNAHVYLLGPLVGQLGMREQLYVRNFRFLWNVFRLQNHIVSTCMDMALDNSNTCIGYKLAFYRYMYSIDIYRTINFSIKQLSGSNINAEQIAIVNNLSTLLSVRSGNNYINDFTLIEVNDLINHLSTM